MHVGRAMLFKMMVGEPESKYDLRMVARLVNFGTELPTLLDEIDLWTI